MAAQETSEKEKFKRFYIFGVLAWAILILFYFFLRAYFQETKIFEILGYPILLFGIFGIPIIFFFSLLVRLGEFFINKFNDKK